MAWSYRIISHPTYGMKEKEEKRKKREERTGGAGCLGSSVMTKNRRFNTLLGAPPSSTIS